MFLCTLLNISTNQTSTLSVKTSPLEVDIMSLTMFEITNIIYNHFLEFTDNNLKHRKRAEFYILYRYSITKDMTKYIEIITNSTQIKFFGF